MKCFINQHVSINNIVALGGIVKKSPVIMQVCADVMNRPLKVVNSEQCCALGAAIFAAVSANLYPDIPTAQKVMSSNIKTTFIPDPSRITKYQELYKNLKENIMFVYEEAEVWFVVDSQHLYGPEALEQIKKNIQHLTEYFNKKTNLPIKIVLKPPATRSDDIYILCQEVNYSQKCVGLITWLHTFSPAKMWINDLSHLQKPLLQLHTQFNEFVPWDSMDMNFMNLNQTAHGGREFGFIGSHMRLPHSIVTGYWQDENIHNQYCHMDESMYCH